MTTFTWLNKQGVQGDRGFTVQFTGRFTAEYRECLHHMTIDVEAGRTADGKQCIIVGPRAFERWDGEGATLSSDQQAELLRNFREAIEFQGLALVVE